MSPLCYLLGKIAPSPRRKTAPLFRLCRLPPPRFFLGGFAPLKTKIVKPFRLHHSQASGKSKEQRHKSEKIFSWGKSASQKKPQEKKQVNAYMHQPPSLVVPCLYDSALPIYLVSCSLSADMRPKRNYIL